MKRLAALLPAALLAACANLQYPAMMEDLGPPTRDPGSIVEVVYDDPAAVHAACASMFGNPNAGARPGGYVTRGCADVKPGVCTIHYQRGNECARRHELAHCTHGYWHGNAPKSGCM